MVENFDAYRSGEGANSLVKEFITQLDAGIASVSQSLSKGGMKVFALNVPEPGKVKCGLTRGEGNLELLMNWDGLLENFDCREESDAAQKACMVGPDSGTAYAIVYASAATADFSITCDVVL